MKGWVGGMGDGGWGGWGRFYLPIGLFGVSMSPRSASQTSLEGLRDISPIQE